MQQKFHTNVPESYFEAFLICRVVYVRGKIYGFICSKLFPFLLPSRSVTRMKNEGRRGDKALVMIIIYFSFSCWYFYHSTLFLELMKRELKSILIQQKQLGWWLFDYRLYGQWLGCRSAAVLISFSFHFFIILLFRYLSRIKLLMNFQIIRTSPSFG